jgi:hypothetical protein
MAKRTTLFSALGFFAIALVLVLSAAPASATEASPPGDSGDPPTVTSEDPPPAQDSEPIPDESADPGTSTDESEPPADDSNAEEPSASGSSTDQPAPEEPPEFDPTDPEQILRDIVFPVVGPTWWFEGFGDCRDGCTRLHEGIDIMTYGWKGVPVVAAHDGVVAWTSIGQPLSGCGVVLEAADGWRTVYTHLNTDTPGTDDDAGPCLAPGIEIGARVLAGTLLGWVGDAGNAEETPPHLHFEIRHPEHGAVDPAVSLYAATRIEHRWIDAEDVASIAEAMHTDATSLYVVPADEIDAVAATIEELEALDIPLVAFDADDPLPAWKAVSAIAPERIVVMTQDPAAAFIGDLLAVAPIVEVVTLPGESTGPDIVPEPADDVSAVDDEGEADLEMPLHGAIDPPDRTIAFDPVESTATIVIATSRTITSNTLRSLGDHPVVLLIGTRPPSDLGGTSDETPGSDANRNGLWWPSADGWRLTEDLADPPAESIAYVSGGDIAPWTLAYLSSRAAAPAMPWWHHQPTSLATKSL